MSFERAFDSNIEKVLRQQSLFRKTAYRKIYREIREQAVLRKLPFEQIEELQLSKLKSIINYAYQHVKLYRDLYDASGVSPDDIKSLNDLKDLPLINRKKLQDSQFKFIISDTIKDYSGLIEDSTSGSSGRPFRFYKDPYLSQQEYITMLFQKLSLGLNPGDKELIVKGVVEQVPWKEKLWRLTDKKTFRIDGHDITDKNILRISEFISKKEIKLLYGFPTSISELCRVIKKNQLTVKIPFILTMGEVLTESMRNNLAECFDAEVFQLYGAAECMQMAHECRCRNGMHIDSGRYFIELLNGKSLTQHLHKGKIVITDLNNRVMPLIRYDIGDIGVLNLKECECGNKFPLLKSIRGRHYEVITTPSGREIFLHNLVDDLLSDLSDHIERFQAVYDAGNVLTLYLVPKEESIPGKILKQIEHNFNKYLRNEIQFQYQIVNKIPRETSGKQKMILNEQEFSRNP